MYVKFLSLKREQVIFLPVDFGRTSSGNEHVLGHEAELEREPTILKHARDQSIKIKWLCLGTFPFIFAHSLVSIDRRI